MRLRYSQNSKLPPYYITPTTVLAGPKLSYAKSKMVFGVICVAVLVMAVMGEQVDPSLCSNRCSD
jgi:hypothetical protein